jgi:ribosomal protein S18 acetylase RimI-like enzyme
MGRLLRIRAMTGADIPAGMQLKEQAGWNQVEADWKRLLGLQPDGCFLAELDGAPAGTVTTCRFGPVAWVAMMLVDPACRRRGIGRALMCHALDALDAHGVQSVRLDATPLGQPLYESLGFTAEATLARFEGNLPAVVGTAGPGGVQFGANLDELTAFDRAVTATDRGRLLRRLAHEHPASLRTVRDGDALAGFLMSRPGSRARQIGPCLAGANAGAILFDDARRRYAGEAVVIDIPSVHERATDLARSWGLAASRLLMRMGRGPRVEEDLARLWASAGPEKG